MSLSGPLAGKTIVVTRPQAQAAPLAEAIVAVGGNPLLFPLLEIFPAADPAPLQALAGRLADYDFAVFVSPNAVEHALPVLLATAAWPETLRPVGVGPGTASALAAHGVAGCLLPQGRYDSEALLELPEFSADRIAGRRVLILRGDGGRELLADTLRARGARVDCVACYRRSGPPGDVALLLDAWRAGRLQAFAVSSSEALRHLLALLDDEGRGHLAATPLFVPHARIAAGARALGLDKIILTGPADAGLLAGLVAYNWSA